MKKITFLIIVFSCIDAAAQVSLESSLMQRTRGGDFLVANKTITDSRSDLFTILDFPKDDAGRYIINKPLRFTNCTFPEEFLLSNFLFTDSLIFENCRFKEHAIFSNLQAETLFFLENNFKILTLDSLNLGRLNLYNEKVEFWTEILSSTFQKELSIYMESNFFELKGNIINVPKPRVSLSDSSLFYEGRPTFNSIEVNKGEQISINENEFNGHGAFSVFSCLFPDAEGISINNNRIKGFFQLRGKSDFLTIRGNEIQYIDVYQFSFPEFKSSIEWDNISGNRLANMYDMGKVGDILDTSQLEAYREQMNLLYVDESWIPQFYFANTQKELMAKWFYDHISSDYYRVYLTFKSQGRIEDANNVYVEMKELHGKRLKALYNANKTTRNFLKWKLNQLLKFYTEHGTQPIKAVVISFYLIAFFGLFYFFFPSSWDDFEFDRKILKEKGLRKSAVLAFKHFLNSFILSLNAFVTLGFGNIPTKGVPRYICVIEGFVGWFLLSLFTVALINQTLF